MKTVVLVASGGALGSAARYLVGVGAVRLMGPNFPGGTLTVNVVGSFIIGLLAGWLVARVAVQHDLWAFLAIGVLGGFTTFSAFSLDVLLLVERKDYAMAAAYLAASVCLSLLAVVAGMASGRMLAP